jgi:hypothetical protein
MLSNLHTPLQALFLAAVAAGSGWGQEVDKGEVLRRGDSVQHVEGRQWAQSDPLAPPADDSGKWHITIIKQQGCRPCATLIRDFENSEALKAWVNVEDYKKSWAKYNVFDADDASQQYRWKGIKITGYPTLLIQPPMDGKFGKPETVVLQKVGYNGRPEALTREMRDGIVRYVEKLAKSSRPSYTWGQEPVGVDPPFAPPPKIDPTQPEIPGPVNPDQPPPAVEPSDLPAGPTAYVIKSAKDKAGNRVEKFLQSARDRFRNLAEIVLPLDEAQKLFPNLNPDSAVVVVDDGEVQEQVSLDNLPIDLTQLPWTDILSLIIGLVSGNPVSWILVGGIALKIFQVVQESRRARGKKIYIPAELVEQVEAYLNSLKKPETT